MNASAAALAALVALSPAMTSPLPTDVNRSAWYGDVVAEFVAKGYVSGGTLFRPGDAATRAEFAALLTATLEARVNLTGEQHFDDVPPSHPAFGAIETAAALGLMKGAGGCLGTRPCLATPDSPVNRAEAATLLLRAHALQPVAGTREFPDNPAGTWYADAVRAAAGNCILYGDDLTGRVRPADLMNRAEMAVMIDRATEGRRFPDCWDVVESEASASSVPTTASSAPRSALLDDAALTADGPLWQGEGETRRVVRVDSTVGRVVFGFAHEDPKAKLSLRMPDGTPVTAANAEELDVSYVGEGGVFDAFDVADPMDGEWIMEASGEGKLSLNALVSSPVQLKLPTAYAQGGTKAGVPMQLAASFDGADRVKHAEVLLRVGSESFRGDVATVIMEEKTGGAMAFESWPTTYEYAFTPPTKGTYCFTAVAKVESVSGETFLREAGGWCAVAQ